MNKFLLNSYNKSLSCRYRLWKIKRRVSGKKGLVYLHIPKCGGTSITQAAALTKPVIWPMYSLGHTKVYHENLEELSIFPRVGNISKPTSYNSLKSSFVFTCVRNPYKWLVSFYFWHKSPKEKREYELAQNSFDYFIKSFAERDEKRGWPCNKMLFYQLFSTRGRLGADWILRLETLDDDLEKLAMHLDMDYNRKQKQNVNDKYKVRDYRSYYSDDLADLVARTWENDLKLLGYTFDGYKADSGMLKSRITENNKKSIFYHYSDNVMEHRSSKHK